MQTESVRGLLQSYPTSVHGRLCPLVWLLGYHSLACEIHISPQSRTTKSACRTSIRSPVKAFTDCIHVSQGPAPAHAPSAGQGRVSRKEPLSSILERALSCWARWVDIMYLVEYHYYLAMCCYTIKVRDVSHYACLDLLPPWRTRCHLNVHPSSTRTTRVSILGLRDISSLPLNTPGISRRASETSTPRRRRKSLSRNAAPSGPNTRNVCKCVVSGLGLLASGFRSSLGVG